MRVTGFNLAEATAEEMYQRGGEQTADGILCKVKDLDSRWTHIRWTDEQMCDRTKNCENEMDEPDFCQKVVIVGSDARDGVYVTTSLDTYKQRNGSNIIFKEGNNRWVIAEGSSDAVAKYKSEESSELLLARGWHDDQGKELMPNLRIFDVDAKQVSVTGSGARNGTYRYHNATGAYKQLGGENWTFKEGGEMYKEEKAADHNGFICKVQDLSTGGNSSEEWTYIDTSNTDPRYCNDDPDCERGEDEPASCHKHSYIVTGSKDMNGVYSHSSGVDSKPNLYQEGDKLLLKRENRWVLLRGSSEEEAFAHYRSGESDTVPTNGWQSVFVEGKKEGKPCGKSMVDLRIFQVPSSNLATNHFETDEGLICHMPEEQSEEWLFIPKGDEKKRRCNGVCECGSCVDEDNCAFHEHLENVGFLVVRGLESEQDGVYELITDSNGNPGFFTHMTSLDWIIYKRGDFWALGNGSSPQNVTEKLSTEGEDVPKTGWHVSKTGWPVDIMRVNKVSKSFSKERMVKGDWEEDEGIICQGDNNQRLFIEKTGSDPFYCNKKKHCPETGMDESSCSIFVDLTFEQPIFSAFGAVGVGILLFFVFRKSLKGRGERKRHRKVGQRLRRSIDQIVDQARILKKKGNEPDSMKVDEEAYKELHETPGGLRALVGTGYSLLSHPGARHMLAKFIVKEEEKIHGEGNEEAWKECVRRKAGSNKKTAAFLDSIDEPGCLKKFKYKVAKVINWMTDHPENVDTMWAKLKSSVKSWVSLSFLPLLNITMHVFDYIKDGWMFNYLFRRLGFINPRCNLLHGLVYAYGASIGVAGVLMGFVVQTDSALLGFDPSTNWCCIAFVRLLLFILTPFLPIIVIMKAVELKGKKKEDLEAMYRDISIDATAKWERIRELDEEEQEVMEALSDLKMVECSTEAIVQFLLLVIFTFASVLLPTTSGLGLLKENNIYEWTFLVFSFLSTIVTVNKAILGAMDIRKNGQLDFKQKVVLGTSFTFQLLSHVFLIVPIALLALPLKDLPAADGSEDASLSPVQASILLSVPIILRWISIAVLHCCLAENETRFWGLTKRKRVLHVLANTWVTMPVRNNNMREQSHKGREMCWSMGLAGINILVTWAMTATLMKNKNPRFLPVSDFNSDNEFLLVGVLPSLFCYLAGCVFLLLHYKGFHPWRKVNTRAVLKEETPCWEEVRQSE